MAIGKITDESRSRTIRAIKVELGTERHASISNSTEA